eukprot:764267-Hanusia_phi.AAC.4
MAGSFRAQRCHVEDDHEHQKRQQVEGDATRLPSMQETYALQACMAFDKDIGRHAPCLSPSPHLQ